MNYPLLIFFGLAPSIVWLLFYLKKDIHPESNRQVIKIFLYGMLAAVPAGFIELGALAQFNIDPTLPCAATGLFFLMGVALPEEALKYLVVRGKIFSSPSMDEPTDIILYMITAALGFAAIENLIIIFSLQGIMEIFAVSWMRFVGATFLHALCSGIVGFFLALSFLKIKNRFKLTILGLSLAATLHALYNFLIIIEGRGTFVGIIIILTGLAVFLSYGFKKVKKLKSICLFSKN